MIYKLGQKKREEVRGGGHPNMMFLAILLIFNFHNVAIATDAPFTVSLKLLKPIAISEVRSLAFPDTATGNSTSLVVTSGDDSAAKFDLVGSANTNIVSTVVENSIAISAPGVSNSLVVDNFTVKAPLALNSQGRGTIGVGGTAHVGTDSNDGNYIGAATLRVVYQ